MELREHLVLMSSSANLDRHYLLHNNWEEMAKHEHADLVSPTDVGLYHWVDPNLVGTIPFFISIENVNGAQFEVDHYSE